MFPVESKNICLVFIYLKEAVKNSLKLKKSYQARFFVFIIYIKFLHARFCEFVSLKSLIVNTILIIKVNVLDKVDLSAYTFKIKVIRSKYIFNLFFTNINTFKFIAYTLNIKQSTLN